MKFILVGATRLSPFPVTIFGRFSDVGSVSVEGLFDRSLIPLSTELGSTSLLHILYKPLCGSSIGFGVF